MSDKLVRIKNRYDTLTNWFKENPVLAAGEIGIDSTNNIMKVGNGSSNWNDLSCLKQPIIISGTIDINDVFPNPITSTANINAFSDISTIGTLHKKYFYYKDIHSVKIEVSNYSTVIWNFADNIDDWDSNDSKNMHSLTDANFSDYIIATLGTNTNTFSPTLQLGSVGNVDYENKTTINVSYIITIYFR